MRSIPRRVVPLVACLLAVASSVTAQFNLKRFDPPVPLVYNGTMTMLLTGSAPNRAASVWHRDRQDISGGFVTAFRFTMRGRGGGSDANGFTGGDGLAFVVQTHSGNAVGGSGGEIGYGGIPRSLAVEFDTFFNSFDDVGGNDDGSNHVSIHTRGASPNSGSHAASLSSTQDIPDLSDGEEHVVVIVWQDDVLRVYIDDCHRPVLSTRVSIEEALGESAATAWIGFTAATGTAWEGHQITAWRFAPLRRWSLAPLCDGVPITLRPPDGFDEYEWAFGWFGRELTVSEPGTYRVTLRFLDYCDLAVTLDYVVVRAGGVRPEVTGETFICQDSMTTLDAGPGFLSYRWSTGATTRTVRVTGPSLVWVEVVDEGGCILADTVNVGVRRRPRPLINPAGPITLCDGDSLVLDAGSGFLDYAWSTGATTRRIVVRDSGAYSVSVSDSGGCWSEPSVVTVVRGALPELVAVPRDTVLCAGGSVRLRASGALTYRWSPPDGLDCTECAEPLARPAMTTTYRVEGVSADGCRALDSLTVFVADTSSADAGADVALCPGESIPLRASGGATYRWSPSAGLSCDTCSDPIARPERTTRYTVFVNESTACGSRDSLLVTVHPPMVVEAGEDAELCDGDSVRLEASGGVRWRWSPAGSLSCVDCRDPVASPGTTTRYHVEAWGVEGCTAVDSVLVTVHAPPAIDAGEDVVICEGVNARLEARGGVGYVWSPTEGLSCSDCSNPLASPARTTHYMLVGTDANGCSGADTVTVSVEPIAIFDLVVPRDLRVAAGDTVLVPVLLASGSTRDLARGLHGLSIQVDERTARIRGITTDGTLLEGAVVSTAKVGVDRLDLRIESLAAAPPSDTLLLVAISAYLGPSDSTEINVWTAVARDRCAQGSATTGVIRVDSICGLGSRLVELLDHGLALRTVRPSPIVDRAEITIATAFDGPARLALSDPAGREVAILLDAVVPAGELMITLETRDLSSGVYTLVLDSNGERRAQRIIVTH